MHYELKAKSLKEIDFKAGEEILCYDEKDNFYGACGVVEELPVKTEERKIVPPRRIRWKN